MKLLYVTLFFAVSIISTAQTPEWQLRHPKPAFINDFDFVNADLGLAVGNNGSIARTTNGGQNWTVQSANTQDNLIYVKFFNAAQGVAFSDSGRTFHTTNSGASWTQKPGRVIGPISLTQFTSPLSGFVNINARLYMTKNGGETWNSFTSHLSNDFYFLDDSVGISGFTTTVDLWNGIAMTGRYKTTNGGKNWVQTYYDVSQNYDPVRFFYLKSATEPWFIYSRHYRESRIAGPGIITGRTYNFALDRISFLNQQFGYSNSLYLGFTNLPPIDTIIVSTDGGINWSRKSAGMDIGKLRFLTPQIAYNLFNGVLSKSMNGGTQWTPLTAASAYNIQAAVFKNKDEGLAAWGKGGIFKTNNGGFSWERKFSGENLDFSSLGFFNDSVAIAAGSAPSTVSPVFRTTDKGNTWTTATIDLRGIIVVNQLTLMPDGSGWLLADNKHIYKTTNFGSSWIRISSVPFSFGKINKIHFFNQQEGIAIGGSDNSIMNAIANTNDGGATWIPNSSSNRIGLVLDMFFLDDSLGWAVGERSGFLKTIDGGQTWVEANPLSTVSATLVSVVFLNKLHGFISRFGTLLETTDGGAVWNRYMEGKIVFANDFSVVDSSHVFAFGHKSAFYAYTTELEDTTSMQTSLLQGVTYSNTGLQCSDTILNQQTSPYKIVKAMPGSFYAFSNEVGKYAMEIPSSVDTQQLLTVQAIPYESFTLNARPVCPEDNQYTVSLTSATDTANNIDFGFETSTCHFLQVDVASNMRRRCFNNTTVVQYVNLGSQTAFQAYIDLEFNEKVIPVSASRNYEILQPKVWRFHFDSIRAGLSGTITIRDSVVCDSVQDLGKVVCTKATIFPASNCPTDPAWNGAELTIEGTCLNNVASFIVRNRTLFNMSDSVSCDIYLDSVQVYHSRLKLQSGDSIHFEVRTEGMPAFIVVSQVSGHPRNSFVSALIDNCMLTTLAPGREALQFPGIRPPESKTDCKPIIGAYDPNDKLVSPKGYTSRNIVPPGTTLDYTIRFQNTGNDTAFQVIVVDTLHPNLNVESLQIGPSSHKFQFSVATSSSGMHYLKWVFTNIKLPDSSTNLFGSQGFARFSIAPKQNLNLGETVANEASIFFDRNPPIVTNLTLTTFDLITFRDSTLNRNVVLVQAKERLADKKELFRVYPNPAENGQFILDLQQSAFVELMDMNGKVFWNANVGKGNKKIKLQVSPGIYSLRANLNGTMQTRKLVFLK